MNDGGGGATSKMRSLGTMKVTSPAVMQVQLGLKEYKTAECDIGGCVGRRPEIEDLRGQGRGKQGQARAGQHGEGLTQGAKEAQIWEEHC